MREITFNLLQRYFDTCSFTGSPDTFQHVSVLQYKLSVLSPPLLKTKQVKSVHRCQSDSFLMSAGMIQFNCAREGLMFSCGRRQELMMSSGAGLIHEAWK